MWRKNHARLSVLLLVLMVLVRADDSRVLTQTTLATPRIIDVTPTDRVDVDLLSPVSLTFNLPMNQASVESALTISPQVAGGVMWVDARTLLFAPEAGWERGTEYTITLSTDAESEAGAGIESDYTHRFSTTGLLSVASIVPEDNTNAVDAGDARIVVTFDRPVVALVASADQADLPNPLTISPDINGIGEWLTTSIYTYTPTTTLLGDTEYSITVAEGLTAVDGSILTEAYSTSFRTLAPQVLSILPTRALIDAYRPVLLDSAFEVNFSQPMDHATTEEAVSFSTRDYDGENQVTIYPAVDATLTWNEASTRLTITPNNLLDLNETYYVRLETTAQTQAGSAVLTESISEEFSAIRAPRIVETSPRSNEATTPNTRGQVRFSFQTPMNTDTFEGRYTISPEPEGEVIPSVYSYDNSGASLTLEFEFVDGETYTVTILSDVEDIFGNTMNNDYTLTFHVREGEVVPRIEPNFTHSFSLAGTYQEQTILTMDVWGDPSATFSIYDLSFDDLRAVNSNWEMTSVYTSLNGSTYNPETGEYEYYGTPWSEDGELLHTWETTFDETDDERIVQVPLTLEDGERLPLGLYGVDIVSSHFGRWSTENSIRSFVLGITNIGVTVKGGYDNSLVWVTDYVTGEPLEDILVIGYQRENVTVFGRTNADGVVTIPDNLGYEYIVATREAPSPDDEELYGIWYSSPVNSLPSTSEYLYTDRPIYRAGETVYFRGVIRDRDDMTYSVPDVTTLYASLGDSLYYYYGDIPPQIEGAINTIELDVSEFGTYSGSFTLPDDIGVGTWRIYVSTCQFDNNGQIDDSCSNHYVETIHFDIAEFTVPTFEVDVTPEHPEIIMGEPINALISANYYFGGALNGANASWQVYSPYSYYYRSIAFFRYTGEEQGFHFSDSDYRGESFSIENVGRITTDINGQYLIDDEIIFEGSSYPYRMTIDATVTDITGEAISAQSNVLVHPANVYIGLRSDATRGLVAQPYQIDLLTVMPDSTVQPNQSVEIEIDEVRWTREQIEFGRYDWTFEEIPVSRETYITDAGGQGNFTFMPPNAGIFRVRAITTDSEGRVARTSFRIYAREATGQAVRGEWRNSPISYIGGCSFSPEYRRLNLQSDADLYAPDDIAEIFIPNPYDEPVTALITIERADVMDYEVVQITEDALTYELLITDEHVPTVYVNVALIQGITMNNPDPVAIRGDIRLNVDPVPRRLNIEVIPSSQVVRPDDTLSFDIRVTDFNGDPVVGEVGVALTDEAVLALARANSGTLENRFYGTQPLSINTRISLRALLTTPPNTYDAGCGGGGGDGMSSPSLRADFIYTPLWEQVVTDENGYATVSLTMPDNLTRWRLDARAVTMDTMVGQTTTNVTSTLPLIVRPVVPRFFVVGDRLPIGAVVNNNTMSEQVVDVSIEVQGITLDDQDLTRQITIPAQSQTRLDWWGDVQNVAGVDVIVTAISQSGYSDASRPALRTGADDLIPVYRYTAPDTVATGGIITDDNTIIEAVSLPTRYTEIDGTYSLQLTPSIAATAIDSLRYLRNYPNSSIEGVISRFLPNLVTARALDELGVVDEDLQANLDEAIEFAIPELESQQNSDGGWGWYSTYSNAYLTAYALLGLNEAVADGIAVNPETIADATRYLRRSLLDEIEVNTPAWRLNWQAFILYVLSQADDPDTPYLLGLMDDLFDNRLELSQAGHAYLLMAYTQLDVDSDTIPALIADFSASAIISASGAHWEETTRYRWSWDSDTRTTALVLSALLRADPEHTLLPNTVRWLMVARQGDHWETRQETVWAVMGLSEWMLYTGELQGNYDYSVTLDDDLLTDGQVTPTTIREGDQVSVPVPTLQENDVNYLAVNRGEGEGVLYYNSTLRLDLPAEEATSVNRGITVTREYYLNTDDETPQTITQAQVGDIITVRLNISLTQDVYYFTLEDRIPAGTEVLNRQLLTTTTTAERPSLGVVRDEDIYWYWGYWYIDRTDLLDDGATLFADYLPRGSYIFTYQIRATNSGEYQVIPAQAYAQYQPDVLGHSAGDLFTITPIGE